MALPSCEETGRGGQREERKVSSSLARLLCGGGGLSSEKRERVSGPERPDKCGCRAWAETKEPE